jgi:hypothetical protein
MSPELIAVLATTSIQPAAVVFLGVYLNRSLRQIEAVNAAVFLQGSMEEVVEEIQRLLAK